MNIFTVAFLGFFVSAMPLVAIADQYGDFNISSDGVTVTITGYTGIGGDVAIPESVYTLPVASIGDAAFYGCTNLTGITIPASVTNIGNAAFGSCSRLIGVYFQGNAPDIGDSAFGGDNNVTVYYYLGATTGWEATFGGRPTAPQNYAFTINDGTVTITGYAGHDNVVVIPSAINGLPVTSLGDMAFYDCTNLTSVTVPGSITNVGELVFSECTSLTSVFFEGDAPNVAWDSFDFCAATLYYQRWTSGWVLPSVVALQLCGRPPMFLISHSNKTAQQSP